MTTRRYDDEEVATIFLRAAEGPQPPTLRAPTEQGLTLSDLQEIGREVGIAPEAVAQAARSLELHKPAVFQTVLGFPSGVERTVSLERRLSEPEWEQLVVRLRETFAARGTLSASGSFRQWTNGNLQALLEPTPTGHRLRLRTIHGAARASIAAGLATLGMTAAVILTALSRGRLDSALPGILLLSTMGLGMFGYGLLRLPSWARRRRAQMDAIAASLAAPPEPPSTAGS